MVLGHSKSGTTISELLVSVVLMAFAFMTIGELVVTTTLASSRLTNCIDGVNGANLFLRRLGEDVRTAQTFGNIYAQPGYQNHFPDTSSNTTDITLQAVPLLGGWPASWPSLPYQLGPSCLIIQQPAYYNNPSSVLNGAPLIIPANALGTGSPAVNIQYVDTVVYCVLPDPNAPNQFMIQRARFSGYPGSAQIPALPSSPNLRVTIDPPQTMLRGVIGPIDPTSPNPATPAVFQYLTITPNPSLGGIQSLQVPPVSSPTGGQVPSIGGLAINLEIETPVPRTGTSKVHHFGSHSQFFLRASSHIRMTNTGTSY